MEVKNPVQVRRRCLEGDHGGVKNPKGERRRSEVKEYFGQSDERLENVNCFLFSRPPFLWFSTWLDSALDSITKTIKPYFDGWIILARCPIDYLICCSCLLISNVFHCLLARHSVPIRASSWHLCFPSWHLIIQLLILIKVFSEKVSIQSLINSKEHLSCAGSVFLKQSLSFVGKKSGS